VGWPTHSRLIYNILGQSTLRLDPLQFTLCALRKAFTILTPKNVGFKPQNHYTGDPLPNTLFCGVPRKVHSRSVLPAIPGVDIKIIAQNDNSNGLLKKGDLVLQTLTGSYGLFLGGPLYDDTEYYVEASKGYLLKELV